MKKEENEAKKRGKSPLTLEERINIEIGWKKGESITTIAESLERNKSSISREIDGKPRYGAGSYKAVHAHHKALARIQKRGNVSILSQNKTLRTYVVKKIKLGWSPEQIEIRLPIEYPHDDHMRISYETIYQYVYAQIRRGGNGKVKEGCEDLRPYLCRRHTRRATKGFRKAQKVERNASLPSIETRPPVVNERSEIGHWEDDTIVSRESSTRIKSINERLSGVHLFIKAKDGTIESCDTALRSRLSSVPKTFLKTLTRDRGSENRGHVALAKETGFTIFFAHSYASYERGSNENGNGLLRRFFPKKTDFAKITPDEIRTAERLINTRPRKRLGGLTPAEVFYQKTGVALFP